VLANRKKSLFSFNFLAILFTPLKYSPFFPFSLLAFDFSICGGRKKVKKYARFSPRIIIIIRLVGWLVAFLPPSAAVQAAKANRKEQTCACLSVSSF
jgi:hypothetical protein